jgi:hypothetical protein
MKLIFASILALGMLGAAVAPAAALTVHVGGWHHHHWHHWHHWRHHHHW